VLPFFLPKYYVGILSVLFIHAILAVSFRFILNMGEWSFAHAVIMGLGGYTTALIATKLGWPFWLTLPLGGLASAAFALAFSYPLLRTKGFYFFLSSFAVGEVLRLCWVRFRIPFGGHQGIVGIPSPSLFGLDLGGFVPYYILTLAITLLCLVAMYRLEKSRIGNILKSIALDDSLARSIGINLYRYKTLAFVTGSFFAGIAGVLMAHYLNSIEPGLFTFTRALYIIVWVIVGGMGTFAGPLIGVTVLTAVSEGLRMVIGLEEWTPFIFGFIMIITLVFLPQGLVSLPQRIRMMGKKGKEIKS